MNKNFLLSLFTLLLISLCSFAQKEYNMVITLNNGTTVTLGHNDIKNITFNDGEVSITGNMVNTIDSLVQASKEMATRAEERMVEIAEERTQKILVETNYIANEKSMENCMYLTEVLTKMLYNEHADYNEPLINLVNALDNRLLRFCEEQIFNKTSSLACIFHTQDVQATHSSDLR